MPTETKTESNKKIEPTITKWSHFGRALVKLKKVKVDGYFRQRGQLSAHTTIIPEPSKVVDHVKGKPFTEFIWELEFTDRPWEGWNEFSSAGVEIQDFRSAVNDQTVPVHPTHIRKFMGRHMDGNRRSRPGGTFKVTLSMEKPIPSADEVFAEDVPDYKKL